MNNKYKIIIVTTLVIMISIAYMSIKSQTYFNNNKLPQYDYKSKKVSQLNIVNYNTDNLEESRVEMKKYGYNCEIINEEEEGQKVSFLVIEVDNNTKIKFQMNSERIYIIKDIQLNQNIEVEISLIGGVANDAEAMVSVDYENGLASCDYSNADFNTPEQRGLKDASELDNGVKNFISTEELNQLRDKTYSIYYILKEIYTRDNSK